ncbi:hypothetical protein Tco_0832410 [Tanacetum coccineum]
MSQLPMKSEEELCPTNVRFPLNKSNVRIDPKEPQDEPIFEICLEILKNNTVYNALTDSSEVLVIYMQQFWHTIYKNPHNKIYFFYLDSKRFEVDVELLRKALNVSPRQPNTHFTQPPTSDELVLFIKRLGYVGSLTTVSQMGKRTNFQRPWGIVKAKNVDFETLWEDFRFQINKHKNIGDKHETIPYLRFTKLIIRYLPGQHPNLHKRLDFTTHLVADDTRLEKLKYIAKGERKHIFGMPIPEFLLSSELKESQVYSTYVDKYPQAQVSPKHGMGKGFMKKGDVPKPKKKKDVAPK